MKKSVKNVVVLFVVFVVIFCVIGCSYSKKGFIRINGDRNFSHYIDDITSVVYRFYDDYFGADLTVCYNRDKTVMTEDDLVKYNITAIRMSSDRNFSHYIDDFTGVVYILYEGYKCDGLTVCYKRDNTVMTENDLAKYNITAIRMSSDRDFLHYIDDITGVVYILYEGYEGDGLSVSYNRDTTVTTENDLAKHHLTAIKMSSDSDFIHYVDDFTGVVYILYEGYKGDGLSVSYNRDKTVTTEDNLSKYNITAIPMSSDMDFLHYIDDFTGVVYIVYEGYEGDGFSVSYNRDTTVTTENDVAQYMDCSSV